ncbi:MAG TPA: OmpA family protein [Caulobacteraceae bacterium]|jgi:outer membrane protein OmpA-like peptidoglycan-associated protein
MRRVTSIATLVVATALMTAPGLAVADTLQGMIISHTGQQIQVRGGGVDTTVTLTDSTKVQSVKGLIGARRDDRSPTDLIPGLAVSIETVQNGSELDAVTVTFKPDDLKTAQAAQAAMHPQQEALEAARQRVLAAQAENERRLSLVGQYDQKAVTRVYFASGSTVINAQGRQDLQSIASKAATTPGAGFRIVGHTDSTGSPALNQRLSDQRASAVTAYLVQNCQVPPEKFMAVAGVGQDLPQDNADMGGGLNRRVAVFLLVSKASEGVSHLPPAGAPDPMAPTPPTPPQ